MKNSFFTKKIVIRKHNLRNKTIIFGENIKMADQEKTFWDRLVENKIIIFIWENIDIIISISLAIYAGVVGIFGAEINYVVSAIAGVLALLSFGIIRDRETRNNLNKKILLFEKNQGADALLWSGIEEKELIKKATNELILIQESGRMIYESCKEDIVRFLNNGGKIKLIIVLGQSNNIVEMMAFRSADLFKFERMKDRLKGGVEMIDVIREQGRSHAKNLEVRFFNYPTDITGVFINCGSVDAEKEALIRLQGFKVEYAGKPKLILNEKDSPKTFKLYYNQIENIWKHSTKCIFLTGNSKVGKSTLLGKIVDELKKSEKYKSSMSGFLTNDNCDSNNKRISFSTTTINGEKTGILAIKNSDNEYILDAKIMTELIIPEIKESIEKSGVSLLIIDEIGPIQLQNEDFKKMILEALETHRISILGIIANDKDPFISKVACNYRTNIIEVTESTRNSLINTVLNEFI
ncbi:MAG: nucleoside-triphosphatase [Bacteroidales bacterium]|jgi:nucleoside-triphosphatase THEP1